MMNYTFLIRIDQTHIAAVESCGRKTTPLELAIMEQTPFPGVLIAGQVIVLTDGEGARVTCEMPSELLEYLRRYWNGAAVPPASFILLGRMVDGANGALAGGETPALAGDPGPHPPAA